MTPHMCSIGYETICEAIPNRPPQAESTEVVPDSLPAEGGQVRIRVIASDDHGISHVRARPSIEGDGTVFAAVNLSRTSGLGRTAGGENRSQWEGVFTVPPNRVRAARTVTLLQMQPYGGDVTLSVKASDNLGISTVTALFRDANGREASVPMPLVTGTPTNGEWRGKWVAPGNKLNVPYTYTIKATATDGGNTTVTSQPVTVTVTPRASSPAGRPGAAPSAPSGLR